MYCAPNLLGESFGVILIEAMAAGAPIVASDLDAFARVLEDGEAGRAGPPRRPGRAGPGAVRAARRPRPAGRARPPAGRRAAAAYDWQVLARRILAVYETVVPPGGGGVTAEDDDAVPGGPPRPQAGADVPPAAGAPLA